jgi:hypothetical protein
VLKLDEKLDEISENFEVEKGKHKIVETECSRVQGTLMNFVIPMNKLFCCHPLL